MTVAQPSASAVSMGSAASAAADSGVGVATAAAASPLGVERRAGSSRVRRLPKRLLSPPPSRTEKQNGTSASSPTYSSSTTKPLAKSAIEDLAATSKASSNKSRSPASPLLATSATHLSPDATVRPSKAATARSKKKSPETTASIMAADDTVQGRTDQSFSDAPAAATTSKAPADVPVTSSFDDSSASADTGPGKRKRKPSTMIKPPATITAPLSTGQPTTKSNTSDPAARPGKARHSTGSCIKKPHLSSLDENRAVPGGYESDGGQSASGADLGLYGSPDAKDGGRANLQNTPDHGHLEAPPLIFQRNGQCLLKHVTASSSHASTLTGKSAQDGSSRRRIKSQALKSHADRDHRHLLQAADMATAARFAHHSRTKSMPSISTIPYWAKRSLQRSSADIGQQNADAIDYDSDSSADEGEHDFHRAMLDSDLDEMEAWHRLSDVDTPATTPRSPQSSCGLGDAGEVCSVAASASVSGTTKRASSVAVDGEKDRPKHVPSAESKLPKTSTTNGEQSMTSSHPSCATGETQDANAESVTVGDSSSDHHNSVFAHALPPSDRPKTHVGLLTLSLPYGDVKVGAPPQALNNDKLPSGMATPTLQRIATMQSQGGELDGSPCSPSTPDSDNTQDDSHLRTAKGYLVSTSPTLSPSQGMFSLPASTRGDDSMDVDGQDEGDSIASPFLKAVHRGHSFDDALSDSVREREISPSPLGLSVSASTAVLGEQTTVTDTTRQAKSPATSAPLQGKIKASHSNLVDRPCRSLPGHSGNRADGDREEEALFSLPETMALDEIDAAYGGEAAISIELPSAVDASNSRSDTVEPAMTVVPATVPTSSSEADADPSSDPVSEKMETLIVEPAVEHKDDQASRKSKRSLTQDSEVGDTAEKEAFADADTADGLDGEHSDSPRPRKSTRCIDAVQGVAATDIISQSPVREASPEAEEDVDAKSTLRRPRRSAALRSTGVDDVDLSVSTVKESGSKAAKSGTLSASPRRTLRTRSGPRRL